MKSERADDDPKIVRILKVVDTRTYEEGPDDKWRPIPGSGDKRCCDRCQREHEIHAYVELDNGQQAIVGTGCMKSSDLHMADRLKSLASAAKRLALLDCQEASHKARVEEWEKVRKEVEALPVPPVEMKREGDRFRFTVGEEGWALGYSSVERDARERKERENCAIEGWRAARMKERGQERHPPYAPRDFRARRVSITKAIRLAMAEQGKIVGPVVLPMVSGALGQAGADLHGPLPESVSQIARKVGLGGA